jgi:hypothetical protein
MLAAAYVPSLWTVQKIVLTLLISNILGLTTLDQFLNATHLVHRRLANAPRRRMPHVQYPVRSLF